MRIKGGRKREDKPKGRGHKKGRSHRRSEQICNGLCNDARGNWQKIDDCRVPKFYYRNQQESHQWKRERNQIARANRGRYGGYLMKPQHEDAVFPPGHFHA